MGLADWMMEEILMEEKDKSEVGAASGAPPSAPGASSEGRASMHIGRDLERAAFKFEVLSKEAAAAICFVHRDSVIEVLEFIRDTCATESEYFKSVK